MKASICALLGLGLTGAVHAACDRSTGAILVLGTDSGTLAVFDKCAPKKPMATFRPFKTPGPVHVAVGDVSGDGIDDIIVGANSGASGTGPLPRIKVYTCPDDQHLFDLPFDAQGFIGGVRVASGDINNDGFDDIIIGAGPVAARTCASSAAMLRCSG